MMDGFDEILNQIQKHGFCSAAQVKENDNLNRITCMGGRALYDSLALGFETIVEVYGKFLAQNLNTTWKIITIVITDGEDTKSMCDFSDLVSRTEKLQIFSANQFASHFIGIDFGLENES